MSVSSFTAPEVTRREAPIRYEESTKGTIWFITKGVILTLLTVGIYRFWFATALRKNLWGRAFVDGSPAEYTGKAHEILLGFLVALAVLLPAYIVVFVATMVSPIPKLGFLVAYLLLFLLVQFARYRARRYLASRTVWRGIRFRQDGSAVRYTGLAAGWWLVTLLTLGLAYPFMRARLERYRMNHTLLGEARFVSEADGFSVITNWMIVWALGVLPIVGCLGILLVATNFRIPMELFSGESLTIDAINFVVYFNSRLANSGLQTIGVICSGSVAMGFVLRPYYRGREARAFLNAIALRGATFRSRLSVIDIYINYFGYIFFSAMAMILSGAVIFSARIYAEMHKIEIPLNALTYTFLFIQYATIILALSWLHFRFSQVGRIAIVTETLTLINPDALDAVTASKLKIDGRLAEGVADAVDPGGIEIGF